MRSRVHFRTTRVHRAGGPPRWWVLTGVAVLAAGLVAGVAAAGSSAAKPAPSSALSVARAAVTRSAASRPASHIPARLACAAMVQNGNYPNPGVPDFQFIKGAPARINSATIIAATTTAPEYCDLKGYITPQVDFELKLPTTQWQGRYLQQGCGGYCGNVTPTTFPACRNTLGGDFAIAATNDGHDTTNSLDALWADDLGLRVDFGYRAVHVLSIASKAIIKAYYGQPVQHSYFVGCSDGGREALQEAQRYPTDFNGIVAGAPAFSGIPAAEAASIIDENTDSHGNAILAADKIPALHAAVVKACDANDGVPGDGLIGDPRDCTFDPASIRCAGADAPTCLTAAQVEVVRKFYRAPVDAHGNRLFPGGLQRGSELSWTGWDVPVSPGPGLPVVWGLRDTVQDSLLHLLLPPGKGVPLNQWPLDRRHFEQVRATSSLLDPLNPDLSAFRRAGGKLMLYQGLADPLVYPALTIQYYAAVTKTMGGERRTEQFARFFTIPGMGHCGGGPSPDTSTMLLQMTGWVEHATAPASITAVDTDPSGHARQRPIYPYPLVSKYIGPDPTTDPTAADDPANFVAARPTTTHDDDVAWVGRSWLTAPLPAPRLGYPYGR